MDHRFRVLFPTNIDAAGSFAETPFAIVERPIHAPDESARWQERVNPEKAFTTFFGVRTGSHGLAVLAPFGLHEYEVTRTPERSLALTLFRSTFKTAGMPAEPDGQLLGEMEFEYLLYPFGVEFDAVQVLRIIAERQAGVRMHYASELPDPHSFLELAKGAAVVTAVKPAADGQAGVIRLWNPAPAAVRDSIKLGIKVTSAALCNLNEESRDLIPLNADGSIPVTIPARGLATVRFTWQ
jgi:alpha-mannosidase